MLYEDLTTGAIAVGYIVSTENNVTGEQAQEMEETLTALNEKHGTNIAMMVPGDSATDHAENPEMPLYAGCLVFGMAAFEVQPWDAPAAVDTKTIDATAEKVAAVSKDFWKDLSAEISLLPANFGKGAPKNYLMCWGPLPFACLCYGVLHPSSESDSTVHTFWSCQDMDQAWLPEGVDGVSVHHVDFTDIETVKLTEKALEKLAQKTSDLSNPSLFITVRYD